MENENPEIQKLWKRDWLILGIATLIIPLCFLLRLPFGSECGPIPFAFVIADMLYFSVAAFDMERLKINAIFRVLIILLFFPVFKILAILVFNFECYPIHAIFKSGNIVHMLYFLLPPILYFLITARNLKLFIKLRRERKNGYLRPTNLILIFLLILLAVSAITIPVLYIFNH